MGYQNRRNQRNNRNNERNPINDVISKINNLDKLCDMSVKDFADEGGYADIVAKNSRDLKTHQLRKFFAVVRAMEQKETLTWAEIEPEFYLLKPKLAVAVARKNIKKPFYNLMMAVMNKVDRGSDEEKLFNFKYFISFFESIVAYHKFHEYKRKNERFRNVNNNIANIITKINSLSQLSDMPIKELADKDGYADTIAQNLKNLNTNQLRKFFAYVRLMEQKESLIWTDVLNEFYLLKPKLAIAVGRGNIPWDFYDLMLAVMKKVDIGSDEDKIENFKVFVSLFESIVAYHKFYDS